MVRIGQRTVNMGVEAMEMFAAEKYVVDTHREAPVVVCESHTVSALGVGTGEVGCQASVGVGDGGVVEVAAKDYGSWQPRLEECNDGVCLRAAHGSCHAQQREHGLELVNNRVAFVAPHGIFVFAPHVGCEMVALKMIVDKHDRVLPVCEQGAEASVGACWIAEGVAADDM